MGYRGRSDDAIIRPVEVDKAKEKGTTPAIAASYNGHVERD